VVVLEELDLDLEVEVVLLLEVVLLQVPELLEALEELLVVLPEELLLPRLHSSPNFKLSQNKTPDSAF